MQQAHALVLERALLAVLQLQPPQQRLLGLQPRAQLSAHLLHRRRRALLRSLVRLAQRVRRLQGGCSGAVRAGGGGVARGCSGAVRAGGGGVARGWRGKGARAAVVAAVVSGGEKAQLRLPSP